MSTFNSLISTDTSDSSSITWEGSGYSTLKFKDQIDTLLSENKNLSKNKLDNTSNKWDEYAGKSHIYCLEHRNDIIKNVGYEYRGMVLKNSLSKILFIESKRAAILAEIEKIIVFLIDHVKSIKKQFNWTLEKDHVKFN